MTLWFVSIGARFISLLHGLARKGDLIPQARAWGYYFIYPLFPRPVCTQLRHNFLRRRARSSSLSGGKLIAPTRAWPPPP